MNTDGGLWRRYGRVLLCIAMVVAGIIINMIALGLTPSQITTRRNSQTFYNISAGFRNVTHISLEYNSDIFWFYGENLALVENFFNPFDRRGIEDVRRNDIDLTGGDISVRMRYYIEDTLLFSATIAEVPPRTQRASTIINTDGEVILSGFFIDGTTLRSYSIFVMLNIGDLISSLNPVPLVDPGV